MTLTIRIEMDNAAFCNEDGESQDARTEEASRILLDLAKHRLCCQEVGDKGKLRDINGNTVGEWRVSE